MRQLTLLVTIAAVFGAVNDASAFSVGECFPVANLKSYLQEHQYSQLGWGWAPPQLNANGAATSIHIHQSRNGQSVIVSRVIGGHPDGRQCIVAIADNFERRARW